MPLGRTVFAAFAAIPDPRASNRSHSLETILLCAIVGSLCGGDGFVQIARIAALKEKLISEHVDLANGIPTHDTIARVLGALDPREFARAFVKFIAELTGHAESDIINIDGKTLRGAVNKRAMEGAAAEDQVHIVSAMSAMRSVVLAQLRSSAVANEEAAARELLRMLDIDGAVITVDAAHTREETFALIAKKGGDVVTGVKGNTSMLFSNVKAAFESTKTVPIDETENGHGRNERRIYEVIAATGRAVTKKFTTIRSFVRVTRQRIHATGPISSPTISYYASSLAPKRTARIIEAIRARWSIENKLHYILDVSFDEDRSRVRMSNAAENLSRIRHIVLSLLHLDKRETVGLGTKRLVALGDDDYVRAVLRL